MGLGDFVFFREVWGAGLSFFSGCMGIDLANFWEMYGSRMHVLHTHGGFFFALLRVNFIIFHFFLLLRVQE